LLAPWITLFGGGCELFEVGQQSHWLANFFVLDAQTKPPKNEHELYYTTPINFLKLHKVEFNLEFGKTTTIGFIMHSIF